MKLLGTVKIRTTAYHPMSNGLIERFYRWLKEALRASTLPDYWLENLPSALLGMRIVLKEDIGFNASELLYRQTLTIPGHFLHSDVDHVLGLTQYVDRLRNFIEYSRPSKNKRTY